MDSAAAELQRRRERAKLSQREFRIRQAKALSDLREENSRLKAVIKDVMDVAQSNDRPALRSVINKAAEVAGLTSKIPEGDTAPTGIDNAAGVPFTVSPWAFTPSGIEQSSALQTWPVDLSPTVAYSLGPEPSIRTTFRLDYGLLGFPTSTYRMAEPPLDILPYLGPNRHSLAGQIYWYCTETSLTLLYQLGGQQPSRAGAIAKHHPFFVAMLRYISTSCSYDYIIALAEARLEFYRAGYCRAGNPAATRDSSILLRERVEQIYKVTEQSSEAWLSPTMVAQAVRETLQGRELGQLEDAVRNGVTALAARKVLDGFIHKLWMRSTCFGDGPKWKASYVKTLLEWLVQGLYSCDSPAVSTPTTIWP